ncbi:MAG: hypothetical protein AB7S98_09630, partial [Burkholderiaceae bacterium]
MKCKSFGPAAPRNFSAAYAAVKDYGSKWAYYIDFSAAYAAVKSKHLSSALFRHFSAAYAAVMRMRSDHR